MAWIWMEPGGFGILNFIYNRGSFADDAVGFIIPTPCDNLTPSSRSRVNAPTKKTVVPTRTNLPGSGTPLLAG